MTNSNITKDSALNYYNDSFEHVHDELLLLDLKLYEAFFRFKRDLIQEDKNDISGLVLSDAEVEEILYHSFSKTVNLFNLQVDNPLDSSSNDNKGFDHSHSKKRNNFDNQMEAISFLIPYLEKQIDSKKKLTLDKKIILSLNTLSNNLQLNDNGYFCLLVCIAFELNSKYEKIFAFLQDDISKKRPSLELVSKIMDLTFTKKIKFLDEMIKSPLFRTRGINFVEEANGVLARPLRINESILQFLIENNKPKINLNDYQRLYQIRTSNTIIEKNNDLVTDILNLEPFKKNIIIVSRYITNKLSNKNKLVIILLAGKRGCGRKTFIKSLIEDYLGFTDSLSVVHLSFLKTENLNSIHHVLGQSVLDALLHKSFLYFEKIEELINSEQNPGNNKDFLNLIINELQILKDKKIGFVFISVDKKNQNAFSIMDDQNMKENIEFIKIDFPDLSIYDRIKIWNYFNNHFKIDLEEKDISDLSLKFEFTIGQIKHCLLNAKNATLFGTTNGGDKIVSVSDIYNSCYEYSNKQLYNTAMTMKDTFTLDDIILPADKKNQLKEILDYLKNQNLVFEEWGFRKKMGLKWGVNVLFSGESGTGKTMAAQIIANELKLEIYKIDLSSLVSKYIGETEKNINKIFEQAKTSNAIIFFDEADAIFGKRTDIKDSHDRYANVEVNYLLQKLEDHDEIVILATNMKQNIDEAFIRRMHFVVDFAFPNEEERLQIWGNVFPKPAFYLDEENIDFSFLARQFKVTGADDKKHCSDCSIHLRFAIV